MPSWRTSSAGRPSWLRPDVSPFPVGRLVQEPDPHEQPITGPRRLDEHVVPPLEGQIAFEGAPAQVPVSSGLDERVQEVAPGLGRGGFGGDETFAGPEKERARA